MTEKRKESISRILRLSDNPDIGAPVSSGTVTKRINSWIYRNNLNCSIRELSTILFIVFTSTLLISLLVFKNIVVSLMLSFFFIFTVFLLINLRSRKENSKKEMQFEQFLLDLVAYLYSDPNILNGIEKTIGETDYPFKWDLERIVNDTKRGVLLKEALGNMIERSSSPIIRIVLTGLIAADEKGIDLINYTRDQINYIREKVSLGNYIKVLSSGPKYTAYLIMLIPMAVLVILVFLNRDILEILFSSPGIVILTYVIVSNFIGFCLVNKIINLHGGKNIIR